MNTLGDIYYRWKDYEQAVEWFTKAAVAGLPGAMYNLGTLLNQGLGMAAPDSLAAAGWHRRAADAGHGPAAINLSRMYTLGRGGPC